MLGHQQYDEKLTISHEKIEINCDLAKNSVYRMMKSKVQLEWWETK